MRWLNFRVVDQGVEKEILVKEQDVDRIETNCNDGDISIVINGKEFKSDEDYSSVVETILGEPLTLKNRGGE